MGTHTAEIVSYTNIARDIDSDAKTVSRYFEILEDTLLGFHLPSYGRSIRKQQRKAEIYRLLAYSEKQFKLSFLRVSETQEIDLIVEKGSQDVFLCKIKSTDKVDARYAQSLKTLAGDFPNPKLRLISNDSSTKQIGNVLAVPWRTAIQEICA